MSIQEIVEKLQSKPSYLHEGPKRMSKIWNLPIEDVKAAFKTIRKQNKQSGIQELEDHLTSRGLSLKDVKKIKLWQNFNGEHRFSIDTKDNWYEKSLQEQFLNLETIIRSTSEPIVLTKTDLTDKKALFVYTSDRHLGAANLDTSLYDNEYNEDVYKERLFKVLDIIEDSYLTFGKFDHIFVCDLGDTSDGYSQFSTRRSTLLPQNLNNVQQVEAYYKYNKSLFDMIVQGEYCNELSWVACSNSNHDGDWGYAMHKLLDVYLECKYPEVNRYLFTKFIDHIEYGKHTFIFTHGKDKIHLKHGWPLILNDKTEVFINDYINYHKIKGFKHVIKGDLHQSAVQYGKGFRYKNVRSMYGASSWIMDNFGNNPAGIDYEIVSKNYNKLYESRIFF